MEEKGLKDIRDEQSTSEREASQGDQKDWGFRKSRALSIRNDGGSVRKMQKNKARPGEGSMDKGKMDGEVVDKSFW